MLVGYAVLDTEVEYAGVSGLAKMAAEKQCSQLVFEYRAAGRNQIMSAFLKSVSEEEAEMRYILRVSEAEERIAKAAVAAGTWTLEFGT